LCRPCRCPSARRCRPHSRLQSLPVSPANRKSLRRAAAASVRRCSAAGSTHGPSHLEAAAEWRSSNARRDWRAVGRARALRLRWQGAVQVDVVRERAAPRGNAQLSKFCVCTCVYLIVRALEQRKHSSGPDTFPRHCGPQTQMVICRQGRQGGVQEREPLAQKWRVLFRKAGNAATAGTCRRVAAQWYIEYQPGTGTSAI